MNLAADAAMLGEALDLCAMREKKMPVLAQLAAGSSAVSIATGDGNISIKATVDATIFETGKAAVSADRLGALVNAIAPRAMVSLTATGNLLLIASDTGFASDNGRYRLPLAEAPAELAIAGSATEIKLDAADLMTLFEPLPAAGTESTRYYLCGVYLHSVDTGLYAVATNGVALLRTFVHADELTTGVIIPSSAVTIMTKLVRRTRPEQVSLRCSGSTLRDQHQALHVHDAHHQ